MTELCEIFKKYKSDKCPDVFHSYSPYYYEILKDYKYDFKNILEIGIGTYELMKPISGEEYIVGSSLRGWRDFFPNAIIYGLDIVPDVIFNDDRINCFLTDQSQETSLEFTINNINGKFGVNVEYDLIIDDGSHIVEHMVLTFNTLKKYLKKGGIYIIEDIKSYDLEFFEKLENDEMNIIFKHYGKWDWDSFLAFKKIK